MWPYVVMIITSCFLLRIAEFFYKKNRFISLIFFVFAITIPAFIAGARDSGIGTDMKVYGDYYFDLANSISMKEFFILTDCELGYGILMYLISFFTSNYTYMYFFIEFIILSLVLVSIVDYTGGKNIAFGMLIYYLLFYSYSLNLMRQCLAISIVLYSFRYVRKNLLFKFLCFLLIATLFHKTSIICIIIYPIYQLFNTDVKKVKFTFKRYIIDFIREKKWVIIFIGLVICLAIVINAREIITLIRFKFNDFHYQYNNMLNYNSTWIFRYSIYNVIILIVTLFSFNIKNEDFQFYFVMMMLNLILYELKAISPEAYRLSLYYLAFVMLTLIKIISINRSNAKKIMVKVLVVLIFSMYSYDYFVLQEYNQIYPYKSQILNIN